MISVEEAKQLLLENVGILSAITVEVADASGYALAENIIAPTDSPPFSQSAMDGFAVCLPEPFDATEAVKFMIIGETKAGDSPTEALLPGTAVRIFTGAPIPENTYCVVMQEKTTTINNKVEIALSALHKASNIRLKACEITKGTKAANKGMPINPAMCGFLSTLGITHTQVARKPFISVLTTGNELKKPGAVLAPGQIYESNSFALQSAIKQCGYHTLTNDTVADEESKLMDKARKMLNESDVLILSGGISVGKYDLVAGVLQNLGVKKIFYKIAQKPGKPLYFGKQGEKLVFALPGNPAAALVCFYEYVLPALHKMSGHTRIGLRSIRLPLSKDFLVKGDRALFLKAVVEGEMVGITEGQESNILMSFAVADALVYIPAGEQIISKGGMVEVHLLPT